MKITDIECIVLLVPDYDSSACSSAQDNIVVRVHTDDGLVGIGETDTNPWVAKAMIESRGTHCMGLGLKEMLLGEDPLDPPRLWEKLYVGSAMTGRRGVGICAMGALDTAMWDLRGQACGVPIWQLLGIAARDSLVPYASLLPTGTTLAAYRRSLVDKLLQAAGFGFRAAKLEVCICGPYAHNAIQEHDQQIVEIVAACREAVGRDMTLMLDVAYCWADADAALRVIRQLEPYDLFFVETPLRVDDLAGLARLAEESPIPIAMGEWQNTHYEFIDLIDRGGVDVVQPDVGRVGGFTEAMRVVEIARERGRIVVPHCWKTGIGIAASAHVCTVAPNCPYIEYLPAELSESVLRRELIRNDLRIDRTGTIAVPARPGLGVELDEDCIRAYRVA